MYSTNDFEFTEEPAIAANVTISRSIGGKGELLKSIACGLAFPSYFGENWDALIDCLSDLSWLTAPEAVIDHVALPELSRVDLRHYLESLLDAAERRSGRTPRLRLMFRAGDRKAIAAALSNDQGNDPTGVSPRGR